MDQRLIDVYDEFTHGTMSRRELLDRLAMLAGGTAAATVALSLLQNDYARAQVVAQEDSRLASERVRYDTPAGQMMGYLTRLKGGEKRPAVIVIHENRGLVPHIEDVARRLAVEGFLVLAFDALSPLGGTPADETKARAMFREIDSTETLVRLAGTVPYLANHPESTGKVGAVGFCWGGGYANRLAAAGTALAASVPYYGSQLPAEEVPEITAPLCLHYAGLDTRINAGIDAYEAALTANNKTYEIYMYEGAGHAFNNDANAARYNKAAADLAWSRTLAFFRKHLTG